MLGQAGQARQLAADAATDARTYTHTRLAFVVEVKQTSQQTTRNTDRRTNKFMESETAAR